MQSEMQVLRFYLVEQSCCEVFSATYEYIQSSDNKEIALHGLSIVINDNVLVGEYEHGYISKVSKHEETGQLKIASIIIILV